MFLTQTLFPSSPPCYLALRAFGHLCFVLATPREDSLGPPLVSPTQQVPNSLLVPSLVSAPTTTLGKDSSDPALSPEWGERGSCDSMSNPSLANTAANLATLLGKCNQELGELLCLGEGRDRRLLADGKF
jgi:hypothetical protein